MAIANLSLTSTTITSVSDTTVMYTFTLTSAEKITRIALEDTNKNSIASTDVNITPTLAAPYTFAVTFGGLTPSTSYTTSAVLFTASKNEERVPTQTTFKTLDVGIAMLIEEQRKSNVKLDEVSGQLKSTKTLYLVVGVLGLLVFIFHPIVKHYITG